MFADFFKIMNESEFKEVFRLKTAVAIEALRNPDFLEKLKSDPNSALTEFTGADFSNVKISVVEEDPDTLVIPIAKVSDELTDEQLEAAAGGAVFMITAGVATAIGAWAAGAAACAAVASVTYDIGKDQGAW